MKVGVIGVGGAGRAHVRRFLKNRDVDQVIGYDIKPITDVSIDVYQDFEAFITNVDAVSICTPDSSHGDYIKRCLERDKHVLVEKPMAASLKETQALESVIKKGEADGLVFAVHHQMRFVPAFERAKRLIETGFFGDIFYLEANYWHDMRLRNTQFDDWRIKEGQSVIFGAACHPLDLIMSLLDDEPVINSCIRNKVAYPEYPLSYTAATSIHQFKSGTVAKCHTNNCAIFPQMNNLIVMGEEATFVDGILYKNGEFSFDIGQSAILSTGKRTKVWNKILRKSLEFFKKNKTLRSNPISIYEHDIACQIIVDNFIDAINHNQKPLVVYEDGRRVIELCESLESS